MDGTVAEGLSVERPHITIDMRWNRAERTLVECFRDAPSGNVSDAAGRVVGMPNAAVIGDLLAGFAFNSGAVAVVTDGMVRDQETLEHFGKPVFAGGITPIGPIGDGPCRVGTPITLGSQVVCSGDLVVGGSSDHSVGGLTWLTPAHLLDVKSIPSASAR